MPQDDGFNGDIEEIEAAPPVESGAELRERRLTESIEINRYLTHQVRQIIHMLLEANDLPRFLEIVLGTMPRHFQFPVAELWLYDPEDVLQSLIVDAERYGEQLRLTHDAFDMQELYDLDPDVLLLDAADPRMFEVLKSAHGIEYAMLMPLMDGGRLMGSLHCGLTNSELVDGEAEEDLVAHLAHILSLTFKNAVGRQQISQLTLLDPLTHISNLRGFEKDIAREIARARRSHQPLSVLTMQIDEYEELYLHYGQSTAQFVMKKVAERISSDLRATDYLARLSESRLAVLLPGCAETMAEDIAERMRTDVDDFAVDDGRGAVLHVTLSIGVVTWDPERYPAVDMGQLARQMQAEGGKGLQASVAGGGNRVSVSRLSMLPV
jgi:diguanylate cyclase (GGDEF)-like protein